ncbi:stalk domain-containing protein [Mesobacillus jeotgali]|uniref:stalk domain-containing protein n=1 Tax=Mesobacillus jeotgali TaxID=129985 RepID=UPI00177E89D3|nr:stalk domain-containing protein [Mesobacillus jeotgali]UYZ21807.1 copper amine oxidase N-terminal domain-containing protein [Mesobacillus jeotgali]
MVKKGLIALGMIMFISFVFNPGVKAAELDVFVNRKAAEQTLTEGGIVYIPLHNVIKLMGDTFEYDHSYRTTRIQLSDHVVEITNGKSYITIDGVQKELREASGNQARPKLINGVQYVPFSFFNMIGYETAVGYREMTKTYYIGPLPKDGINPTIKLYLDGYSHEETYLPQDKQKTTKYAAVYAAPSTKARKMRYIEYPYRFRIIASKEGFYQVVYRGSTGWVKGEHVTSYTPARFADGKGPSKGQSIADYLVSSYGMVALRDKKGKTQAGLFHAYLPGSKDLIYSTFYFDTIPTKHGVEASISMKGWDDQKSAFYHYHPAITREMLRLYFPDNYKYIFGELNKPAKPNVVPFGDKWYKFDDRWFKVRVHGDIYIAISKKGMKNPPELMH